MSIDLGTAELTKDEMWPDGDAPEHPTAADVIEAIKSCGGIHSVVSDWNLLNEVNVSVTVDKGDGSAPTSTREWMW